MAVSKLFQRAIFGPFVGLLGLGLLYVGVGRYSTASALKAEGLVVPGKVIDGHSRRNPKSTSYFLTVSYRPRSTGTPIQRDFEVSSRGYAGSQKDAKVQIRHQEDDPKVAQIVGEEDHGFGPLAAGALLIFSGVYFALEGSKEEKPGPVTGPA